jgi:hypothetical protein
MKAGISSLKLSWAFAYDHDEELISSACCLEKTSALSYHSNGYDEHVGDATSWGVTL